MNKLRKYLLGPQVSYEQISNDTGIPIDVCRNEIERMNKIIKPSGNVILYPELLPWHLIDEN